MEGKVEVHYEQYGCNCVEKAEFLDKDSVTGLQ